MAINVGALRKFQEVWGPVLDAIPAVVEMTERQADMEREANSHRAEMDKAKAEIQKAYDEADVRLSQFNSVISELQEQKNATAAEIREMKRKATEAAKAAQDKADAKLADVERAIDVAVNKLKTIDVDYAERTMLAKTAHEVEVKAMAAEIADLEKRKAAAEKALDALRAKLG